MKYKNKWKTNNLNKSFWKEVLENKTIEKVVFSKDDIKYILLDRGEKIFFDGYKRNLPMYIEVADVAGD